MNLVLILHALITSWLIIVNLSMLGCLKKKKSSRLFKLVVNSYYFMPKVQNIFCESYFTCTSCSVVSGSALDCWCWPFQAVNSVEPNYFWNCLLPPAPSCSRQLAPKTLLSGKHEIRWTNMEARSIVWWWNFFPGQIWVLCFLHIDGEGFFQSLYDVLFYHCSCLIVLHCCFRV